MSQRPGPNINFLDKSFQENAVSSYVLTLQLNTHTLSYAVYDPKPGKFTGLGREYLHLADDKPLPLALKEVTANHPILSKDFGKVLLAYGGLKNTLVPRALFKEDMPGEYLAFNFPVREDENVLTDSLNNPDALNIYAIPDLLQKELVRNWPAIHIQHLSSILIESLNLNFKHTAGDDTVFLNVREDCFDLIYFRNSRLYFYNVFRYQTREDFIYFLLASFEQLKLNPESAKLVLMGTIDKNSQIYEMIHRYIRNSSFIENNSAFRYSYVMDDTDLYPYYCLFAILQCES